MSIYILMAYAEEVGKRNISWEGLKKFKEENWRG